MFHYSINDCLLAFLYPLEILPVHNFALKSPAIRKMSFDGSLLFLIYHQGSNCSDLDLKDFVYACRPILSRQIFQLEILSSLERISRTLKYLKSSKLCKFLVLYERRYPSHLFNCDCCKIKNIIKGIINQQSRGFTKS